MLIQRLVQFVIERFKLVLLVERLTMRRPRFYRSQGFWWCRVFVTDSAIACAYAETWERAWEKAQRLIP